MAARKGLITAGLIVVVVAAGAIAVGANLGILNAAEPASLGVLTASAAELNTAAPARTGIAAPAQQKFIVERAGSVSVVAGGKGIRVADVSAGRGWKWKLVQTAQRKLTVTFKSRKATYVFTAVLRPDGTIKARLQQPVTRVVKRPAAASQAPATASVPMTAAPATGSSGHAGGDDGEGEDEGHGGGEEDD